MGSHFSLCYYDALPGLSTPVLLAPTSPSACSLQPISWGRVDSLHQRTEALLLTAASHSATNAPGQGIATSSPAQRPGGSSPRPRPPPTRLVSRNPTHPAAPHPQRPHSLGIARTPRQRPLRPGAPHGPTAPRALLSAAEELGPAVPRRGGLRGTRYRFPGASGPFRGAAPPQPPQPLDGHGTPRAPPARAGRGSGSGSSRGRCGRPPRPVPAPEASMRAAEPFPARDAAKRSGEEP